MASPSDSRKGLSFSFSRSSSPTSSIDSASSSASRLSKDEIEEIINSPYNTGYTYSQSAAYCRNGTEKFRHPQLCRSLFFQRSSMLEKVQYVLYASLAYLSWLASGAEGLMTSVRGGITNSYFSRNASYRYASQSSHYSSLKNASSRVSRTFYFLQTFFVTIASTMFSYSSRAVSMLTNLSDFYNFLLSRSLFHSENMQDSLRFTRLAFMWTASVIFHTLYWTSWLIFAPFFYMSKFVIWLVTPTGLLSAIVRYSKSLFWWCVSQLQSGSSISSTVLRAILVSIFGPFAYVVTLALWLASGGLIGSGNESSGILFSSPKFTSTPAGGATTSKRQTSKISRLSAAVESSEKWRRAGRLFGYLIWSLPILFVLLGALYILTSKLNFEKPSTYATNAPLLDESSDHFQSQIDELRDAVSKINAEREVLGSRLSAVERQEKYERLLVEMKEYMENRVEKSVASHAANVELQHNHRITIENDSAYLARVQEMIREHIRLYDLDKTGLADYALESSGGSIASIRCTVSYNERSRTQKIFGIPLWHSSYSPRSVIQRKGYGTSAGECWAFVGSHGYLTIKLSNRVDVTAVSYEHLPVQLSPDGHIQTAPRDFLVYSYQDVNNMDSRFLLGNFTYDDKSDPLQMFAVQHHDLNGTPIIELETLSNYGAAITCLYRFRVHGNLRPDSQEHHKNDNDSKSV